MALRHSMAGMPAYLPHSSFMVPSSFITRSTARLWRWATSKSLGSWAGVILTAPVPNSFSTYSSATTGMGRLRMGSTTFLPIRCW